MMPSDANPEPVDAADEVAALRAIVEGTVSSTGSAFFETLVTHLARVLDVGHAFVAEFDDPRRVRTLALWQVDRIADNVTYEVAGTPCADVVQGNLCHHPDDIKAKFPADAYLFDWDLRSYLGVPLADPSGVHLGHLAVADSRPMPSVPRNLMIFRIFAARAAAELARLRDSRRLADSEQRYRDLFEEAPVAYVYEATDSRFISANRVAQRVLGLRPEQVRETYGRSLVPQDDESQSPPAAALSAGDDGHDAEGRVVRVRRRDNGEPVWIRRWGRKDRDGGFERIVFVDVTPQVLAEQEKQRLEQQNAYLREELQSVHNFEEIIGRSPTLLRVLDDVRRVAVTDASVLVLGETGTGKELIARAIHNASPRKDRPLIKVNCAALPTGLVESELFGHERGAFSGAIARRIGRFELANGGTIFLDEIGELPLDVQVKLLRVLQEREFERVGGQASLGVDVRVIAATNRDLARAVADGAFRQDLYYRLNVFPLTLPPLRERIEDVPLLVRFLLDRLAMRLGRRIDGVDEVTLRRLKQYAWPGNVRELENVIERAAILTTGPTLHVDPSLLPLPAAQGAAAPATLAAASQGPKSTSLESMERGHILDVLARTRWVIDGERGAATLLGMHPNTLRSRLKKLGIRRPADPVG